MDKAVERSGKEKVLRRLAGALRPLGFERTKPTFFTRRSGLVVEFIHLHKYTFEPSFRVHLGIRVVNDPSPDVALNGPDSHAYVCKDAPGGRKYNFGYHIAAETVDRCAGELTAYVQAVAEPWFQMWRDTDRLLNSAESPLLPNSVTAFREALVSGDDPARAARTLQKLL